MTNYQFTTNLPPGEIISRVSKQKVGYFSAGGIVGKTYGARIEIWYQSFNPWTPVFYGSVARDANETIITGTFKEHHAITISVRAVRCLLLIMPVPMLLGFFFGVVSAYMLLMLLAPLLMYVILFAMEKGYFRNDEKDKDEILRFMKKVLEATPHTNERVQCDEH